MNIIKILILVIVGVTFLSGDHAQPMHHKTAQTNAFEHDSKNMKFTVTDTITFFLAKALNHDKVEFNNQFEFDEWQSFLFFKSGHIISDSEKNVLTVYCSSDTSFAIKLYSLSDNKWKVSDSIEGLDAFPRQFDAVFDDYNFDGQTDIYIQVSASNGWSLSRGHLLTIDPVTKKIAVHNEARDLANMKPDPNTKTVKSEIWNGYNMQGQSELTIFTNKWVDGQLKTIEKKNITLKQ